MSVQTPVSPSVSAILAPEIASEPTAPAEEASSPKTVYGLIHALQLEIVTAIDSSLSWEELTAPGINYTIVRPIVERYTPKADSDEDASHCLGAILYALMANRIQFSSLAKADLSYEPLQSTRAAFCELLAIKILRNYPNTNDEADMTSELVHTWGALDGAPDSVWDAVDDKEEADQARSSALELMIVSNAKRVVSQPLIQHLVGLVHSGHLIYAPVSTRALIPDSYVSPRTLRKRRRARMAAGRDIDDMEATQVYVYNPYQAGWLDYQRLRVPRWRHLIEFGCFLTLLILFVAALSTRSLKHATAIETIFIVYTVGFILDEFAASKEHGWDVYVANAWNAFDLTFIAIFLMFFFTRIVGLATHNENTSNQAFDILACGACVLFPRLVFFFIKNNVVVLALGGMLVTFLRFMAAVSIAFSGVCFCLWMLAKSPSGDQENNWTVRRITWLMLQIWFGSSSLSFSLGESFHKTFGPIILISWSCLCSTLIITMMMSMISYKFSRVNSNAQQEHLFQRVVSTVEGCKSDAVFSYVPPFNILALVTLLPLSTVASPETLHSVNVALIRVTNFPSLFLISAYERYHYRQVHRAIRLSERNQPEIKQRFDTFLGVGSEALVHAAFDLAPPVPQEVPAPVSPVKDAPKDLPEDTEVAPPKPVAPKRERHAESLGKLFRADQGATVTVSAQEWKEVRDSQKRLEEMLEKMLVISGAEKE